MEAADQGLGFVVRQIGEGRDGAHPAGVRTAVAVAEALVVTGDGQGDRPGTVADRDDARFRPDEALLDDDRPDADGVLDRGDRLGDISHRR